MQLSDSTIKLLMNFSSINAGIVIRAGNVLKTVSASKAVYAEATIPETFDRDIGIYDLKKFLTILSLQKNPDIEINDIDIVMREKEGKTVSHVRLTPVDMIVSPTKSIPIKDFEVSFELTEEQVDWIQKMTSVLGCPHVIVQNKEGKIAISAAHAEGKIVDSADLFVGDVTDGSQFKMTLNVQNLKMIKGSYNVDLSSKWAVRFKNKTQPVTYWMALEKDLCEYTKAA